MGMAQLGWMTGQETAQLEVQYCHEVAPLVEQQDPEEQVRLEALKAQLAEELPSSLMVQEEYLRSLAEGLALAQEAWKMVVQE
jgi:hypothetical protein